MDSWSSSSRGQTADWIYTGSDDRAFVGEGVELENGALGCGIDPVASNHDDAFKALYSESAVAVRLGDLNLID